ncbi:hypothetical protein A1Q2_04152 [Trichosporon asahii var. asahii CBS 8904]|uniref:Uncharacterized protein n=2 Tax=Trichosporon asahii var. asahii TaxID=189963 RepID=K1VLJ1_TRIAC|nr:hypothetical protein A1Q1_03321 [Trichosporon asahii var. asahii CBS 2479]EJT47746.1 hypothetical protein A1Q1_03321 [Trichosporon asahii var. asahii CBS 2479]EKD01591.1 hypothetical protein A1Q2_04152 [Trichosporon asahii var. asahii CBS 8904]
MATTTSLLHTALQNLHVAQQVAHPSHTPRPASSVDSGRSSRAGSRMASDDEDDELVTVGKGTAPGTPIPGKGQVLGQRIKNASNDPNRALHLPQLKAQEGKMRTLDDGTEFFDPYDKGPKLSTLAPVPLPKSAAPQWSKAESKKAWKAQFKHTLYKGDDDDDHPNRVDVSALSSGYSTPGGGRHAYSGLGSGNASRWGPGESGSMTPSERKLAAREEYKALGGRKSRRKRKMAGELGARDKGGAAAIVDDGRFDCPW